MVKYSQRQNIEGRGGVLGVVVEKQMEVDKQGKRFQ